MRRSILAACGAVALVLTGGTAAHAVLPGGESGGAPCKPSLSQGAVSGYSHNGARIFSRVVTVRNPCSDTTWTLDIRPFTLNKAITVKTGATNNYAISSSITVPAVVGILAR